VKYVIDSKFSRFPDVQPPNSPWQPLKLKQSTYATITFSFGDSMSKIAPIRDVSCKGDPKPDPNYETKTYGLFSGCCKDERKSIVEKGVNLQFFCTARESNFRVLTGYYRPLWYCKLGEDDYAIAAKQAHFISPGFALKDLVPYLNGFHIDKFFRRWKYLPEDIANRLVILINNFPNAINEYVSEVNRLESYALKKYGTLYHDRTTGFNWEEAAKLFKTYKLI
jgi:hypothetical protein